MPSQTTTRRLAAALCTGLLTVSLGAAAAQPAAAYSPDGAQEQSAPGNSGNAGRPDSPGNSGNAGRPDSPGNSGNAGRPDSPGNSGNAGRPENPGKPDNPGRPGGDDAGAAECAFAPEGGRTDYDAGRDSLRAHSDDGIRIGNVAAGGGHFDDEGSTDPFFGEDGYQEHLAAEYSSITHENYLKWEFVHPEEGVYDFEAADAVVEFAQAHDMDVRGHALSWHSQNPDWLEEGDHSPEELRGILEDHVRTVVSRYAGCIQQWDVANEIFGDDADATIRDEENIWIRELGVEVLDDVFRWAHEEDPDALLFYNDYNVDGVNAKSDAYYDLVQGQLERGVPVHGFGAQTHLSMNYGFDETYQENLERFDALGLYTAVTEIDVRGDVGEDDRMNDEDRAGAAERFETVLQACLEVDNCNSFTIWGTLDAHSWVPGTFPGEGDATLHEGDYERKPTYCVIQRTLVEHQEGGDSWAEDAAFEECRGILEEAGV
ncbi:MULTISPECIES: endo-1,4-beta-xylanase [Actinomycetes]|uniref:Beta-xylanase n=2 Tax=Actinomycetes TaxID=1760 RepID=A0ABP6LP35_9MICC